MITLRDFPNKTNFLPLENGREINYYTLTNCNFLNLFYPNVIFQSFESDDLYNPIDEKIMSLISINNIPNTTYDGEFITHTENSSVFFFIYNTDNYYHFVYDSLPYLITYLKLKEKIKDLKLLMNYPNSQATEIYRFVYEFLELLGIKKEDILIVNKCTLYKTIYFSDSFTHGIDSNLPPRKEIFDLYNNLSNIFNHVEKFGNYWPYKIYISRRSHIHGDYSNIGTNYTSRRKCQNEDELVEYLKTKGYIEVFTEKISIREKIILFNNATHIVGPFGGGLANVVFCNPNCQLTIINSPGALEVNKRFLPSLNRVKLNIFNETYHTEIGEWKRYMRVHSDDIIGEVTDFDGKYIKVSYLDEKMAGFNNSIKYKEIWIKSKFLTKLDDGLNSMWKLDLNKFKELDI